MPCEDRGKASMYTSVIYAAAAGLGVLALVVVGKKASSGGIEDMEAADGNTADAAELTGMLSALLPYLQRFGSLDSSFPSIKMPSVMLDFLGFFKLAVFSLPQLFAMLDPCALFTPHTADVRVAVLKVPYILTIIGLAYVLLTMRMSRRGNARALIKSNLIGVGMTLVKLAHPGIGYTLLGTFLCRQIDSEEHLHLAVQYELVCYDWDGSAALQHGLAGDGVAATMGSWDTYQMTFVLSLAGIIVWVRKPLASCFCVHGQLFIY